MSSDGHSIQVKRRFTSQTFDDAGTACASVAFDFDAIDAHLAAEQEQGRAGELSIAQEDLESLLADTAYKAARKVLSIVTAAPNARAVGLNALIFAHILQTTNRPTQRTLARQCKLSPGRVSQLIKALRCELVGLNAKLPSQQGGHAQNEGHVKLRPLV